MTSVRPNLSIIFTMDCALVLYLKTHHKMQCHVDFLLFCSRSFKVLHFTYKSVMDFDLIFMKSIRFLCSFPSSLVVKIISSLCTFVKKSVDYICVCLFLSFSLYSIDLCVYFSGILHHFDYCTSIITLK